MKKILTTLAAVLCCAMTIMAEPVSPEAARQAAAKFLNKKGSALKSEATRAKNRAMGCNTDSETQTQASPYYVFNATASQGFVVVSGDDCVGDNLVLGYTSQGSFDAATIPDNLQWWLDETANQISTLSRLGVKAKRVALHDNIAPMLTTRWDQSLPYNASCPVTDGQLCLTGCMATALAQVMHYHRWPQGPMAEELPAYTMENGRVIDGLPITTFDWDNMVDDYTTSTTEAQQVAVATLMRYCGQLNLEHNGTLTLPLTNDLFGNLTPGRHNLVFVNREAGSSAPWKPLFGPNCYFEVNVGETGEVASVTVHPKTQLTAIGSDIKIDGLKQRGISQKVTATIQNTGTEDYMGGIECAVYYVENGELNVLTGVTRTGTMVEAGGSSDVYFNFSAPMAGEYVLVLTKQGEGEDITGSKLADIAQAPGYMAHTSVTFDNLAFFCQYAEYNERNDEKGNPAYYLDLVIANGTPMDYDAAVLAKIYKPNAEGGYTPVVFPSQPNIYTRLQLGSNMWRGISIRLSEPLESGEYEIDLLIAKDFYSLVPSDYFIFASGPITVTSTTGIEMLNKDGGMWNDDSWYTINGQKLIAKPSQPGLYIHNNKKVIIK